MKLLMMLFTATKTGGDFCEAISSLIVTLNQSLSDFFDLYAPSHICQGDFNHSKNIYQTYLRDFNHSKAKIEFNS